MVSLRTDKWQWATPIVFALRTAAKAGFVARPV
jgi:hypothetical protein